MNASLKKKAPLCATEPTVPVSPPPPIPRKGPPAAAEGHSEGHSRPLSPPGLSLVCRAPSGFTSVLFCRVVFSLPLAVPTLPSP